MQFFHDDSKNGTPREAFYQENKKPRMILLDRKGAGAIDAFDDDISPNVSMDSDYSRLHAVPNQNKSFEDAPSACSLVSVKLFNCNSC